MLGALLYLRLTSLRNLVVFRLGRMRQPKYLVGTAAAAAYFYFFFLRRFSMSGAMRGSAGSIGGLMIEVVCVFVCAVGVLRILYAWVSPPEKPGLQFSEAEIAFLFPAPVKRKSLIHFRLLSGQLAILFTSLIVAVLFNRFGFGGGTRLTRAIGLWVVLSTFGLHLSGTNLSLSCLRERSAHFLAWRIAVILGIVLYVGAIAWSALAAGGVDLPASFQTGAEVGDPAAAILASPAFHWLILPFRIVLAPYFSRGYRELAVALVPALALLAAHYFWVANSEASFEEGSIALAEKRGAARAAFSRGEAPKLGGKPKVHPGPFPLSPTGPVEVAFLWKNLLSMRSTLLTRRAVITILMLTFWMAFALRPLVRHGHSDAYGPVILLFCAIAGGYTLLVGPQIARQDLRGDLPNADMLKTFPIEGWRLALGELLAPTLILAAVLWFLITLCFFLVDAPEAASWLTPSVRVITALSMATAAPVLCVVQLIVPNLIMVLFPGWYQASRTRGGGIELMGQRLILGIAQLVFALFVAAPAAGAAVLIIFASFHFLGAAGAIVLATAVVLPILLGEVAVGLWCIGDRFEAFDPSSEIR